MNEFNSIRRTSRQRKFEFAHAITFYNCYMYTIYMRVIHQQTCMNMN